MKFVKTPTKHAEEVKRYLLDQGLFKKDHRFIKEGDIVYFPVSAEGDVLKKFSFAELADKESESINRIRPLKDILETKLSKEEMAFLKTAHDMVGSIAIIDVPEELKSKDKLIAKALLESQKSIKTVLKKSGAHEGIYRIQKMVHLAGEKTKETVYTENGVRLKLNVETVYFSARTSTERKRIAEMVKPDENILVMFSGCAPYPCVLSRNTKARHIVGIELNPEGHKYGLENVKLNKLKNVELYNGDVRKVVPNLEDKTFDRIIMPLPHTADDFLDVAFSVSKKGTIIHMYDFMEEELPEASIDKINAACKDLKRDCKILELVKCGQFSPRTFRICVDFMMK